MKGAIIGDIIGSRFERNNTHFKDFNLFDIECKFTDDTVLTIAVADAYMNKASYHDTIYRYGNQYPDAGYGAAFRNFLTNKQNPQPYNSWANGSAMRISALAWLINDAYELLAEVKKSAEVTHNHPEGIKGAQAIALCILLARKKYPKEHIKETIEKTFGYNLDQTVEEYRLKRFDVSCQGSVPQAIVSFLVSTDFEDCLRTAISTGGDSDTIASMACAIAEAFYGEESISNELSYYCEIFILSHPHFAHILTKFYNIINEQAQIFNSSN